MLGSVQFHRNQQLKVLAVTSLQRLPNLPDVATAAESLPGFECASWYGLWAPAGTPAEIVNRLNEHVRRSVALPETREKLIAQGATPNVNTPPEFAGYIRDEYAKWAKVIQTANIKLDQ